MTLFAKEGRERRSNDGKENVKVLRGYLGGDSEKQAVSMVMCLRCTAATRLYDASDKLA